MAKYEVYVMVSELDESGEPIDGSENDLSFELETDESPVSVLLGALQDVKGAEDFCT